MRRLELKQLPIDRKLQTLVNESPQNKDIVRFKAKLE